MTSIPKLTFEQFQATRKPCDDIGAAVDVHGEDGRKTVGNLYCGVLYIEKVQDWWPAKAKAEGDWHLLIGRSEYISSDLQKLERLLYEFARSEDYC